MQIYIVIVGAGGAVPPTLLLAFYFYQELLLREMLSDDKGHFNPVVFLHGPELHIFVLPLLSTSVTSADANSGPFLSGAGSRSPMGSSQPSNKSRRLLRE